MAKKPTNLRVGLGTAVLVLALATAAPLNAADYPLLPPDNTGKLYATERACDCVLAFSADGSTVEVLVTRDDLALLLAIAPDDVSLNRSGIVATD